MPLVEASGEEALGRGEEGVVDVAGAARAVIPVRDGRARIAPLLSRGAQADDVLGVGDESVRGLEGEDRRAADES